MSKDMQIPELRALTNLVNALDNAFISSWQSPSAWAKELDIARLHINFNDLSEKGKALLRIA